MKGDVRRATHGATATVTRATAKSGLDTPALVSSGEIWGNKGNVPLEHSKMFYISPVHFHVT